MVNKCQRLTKGNKAKRNTKMKWSMPSKNKNMEPGRLQLNVINESHTYFYELKF